MNQKTLNIIYGLVVVALSVAVVYFIVGKKSEQAEQQPIPISVPMTNTPNSDVMPTSSPVSPTENWKTYSSVKLGVDFKFPTNFIIMDLLDGDEKAILLGDKSFPKPEIAPWYHAPISISKYNESRLNDLVLSLSNIKRSAVVVDGQTASIIEGNFPDYPAPAGSANNNIKIVVVPSKKLTILAQDDYAGTKSDWKEISSALEIILTTLRFK